MNNCWICGEEGNTGEHLTKASDFSLFFPDVTQENPVYLHNSERINQIVRSKKSKILKSKALICNRCNSSLTQPHDYSWEKLSLYIYDNWNLISKKNRIQLKKVFPGSSSMESKNVHLYFLKLFGCLLSETEHISLVSSIARSIRDSRVHENIEMFFFNTSGCSSIGISNLEITYDNANKCVGRAHWIYSVGECSIKIRYLDPRSRDLERRNGWHPSRKKKTVRVFKI